MPRAIVDRGQGITVRSSHTVANFGGSRHALSLRNCAATTPSTVCDDGVQADPMELFGQWLNQARKTEAPPAEANSMALATVDRDGHAHCRILLLKGFSAEGFLFGNYQSAKGQELASNPHAAMTFSGRAWSVRCVEGPVVKVDEQLSDDYFDRPAASQLAPGPRRRASPEPSQRAGLPACARSPSISPAGNRHGPNTGAGTACNRAASSSGKAAPTACTTASTIACMTRPGSARAWLPERGTSFEE
jgi:pyridoxamine 5'-phosphate oxidase